MFYSQLMPNIDRQPKSVEFASRFNLGNFLLLFIWIESINLIPS